MLAAATSTGGVTLKMVGRVGDSPFPGAGNYASPRVAASATGTGEFVLRSLATRAIAERVEHGASLADAVAAVLGRLGEDFDADVGLIAVDRAGHAGGHAPHARHAARLLLGHRRRGLPHAGLTHWRSACKIPVSTLVVVYTPRLDVLLIERADRPGYWQSVTGSQDPGETLLQTAIREVREETGIDATRHALPTGRCPTSTRSTPSGATATRRA